MVQNKKCSKTYFYLGLLLLVSLSAFSSRYHTLDSLKRALLKAKNDTVKVDIMLLIADQNIQTSPDTAILYLTKTLSLSKEIKYQLGTARALEGIGEYYFETEMYSKSLVFFHKAADKYNILQNVKEMRCWEEMSRIHYQIRNYPLAIKYSKLALQSSIKQKNEKWISKCYNNLGVIYKHIKNNDSAIYYYQKSLSIKKKNGDQVGIAKAYNNIGNVYLEKGDIPKAISLFQNSIAIKEKLHDSTGLSIAYENLATAYVQKAENEKQVEQKKDKQIIIIRERNKQH